MGQRSGDKWFVHFATRWCSCTPGSRDRAAAKRVNRCPTYGTQGLATQLFCPKPSGLWNLGTITGMCLQ